MKIRSTAVLLALMLVVAACSSEPTATTQAQAEAGSTETTTGVESATASDATTSEDAAEATDDPDNSFAEAAADGAEATLTLENGETFTFNILCSVEPQIAAGQEILFSVTSYDTPYHFDATQFGADSLNGAASVTVYEGEDPFDTVWTSGTLYGSELELAIDGRTVTGHGIFHPSEDEILTGEGVAGELVANC